MTICKDDQIKNPVTGRCVSKTGAIGKKILKEQQNKPKEKPCPEDNQIRNPKSGRCVSKMGAIGKKILKEQKNKPSPKKQEIKPCPNENEIRNPKTNRCVSKMGAIGKKILKEQSQRPKSKSRESSKSKSRESPKKGCKKPCKSEQICNVTSGRCVSRTGAIGKEILKGNNPKSRKKKSSSKYSSPPKRFYAKDRVIVNKNPGVVLSRSHHVDSTITYEIKFDNIEKVKTNVPSNIVESEENFIKQIIIDNGGLEIVTKRMLKNILEEKGIIYNNKIQFNDIVVNIANNMIH